MDQQITCSACGHAFKVSTKALWIICPQCGHSLDATGEHRQVTEADLTEPSPDDPTRVTLETNSQDEVDELDSSLDTLFDDEDATMDEVTIGERPSNQLIAATAPTKTAALSEEPSAPGQAITDSADDLMVTSPALTVPTFDLDNEIVVTDESIGDQTIADDEAIGDRTIADDEAIGAQPIAEGSTIGNQTLVDDEAIGTQTIAERSEIAAPEAPTIETPQRLEPPPQQPPAPPSRLGTGGQLGRIALRKVPASRAKRASPPVVPPPPAPPSPPAAQRTDPFADPDFADGPLLDADRGVTRIKTEMEGLQDASTNPSVTRPPPLPPPPAATAPAATAPAPPRPRSITQPPPPTPPEQHRQRTITQPRPAPAPPRQQTTTQPPAPIAPVGTGLDLPERPAQQSAPNAVATEPAAPAGTTRPFAAGSRREALKVRTGTTRAKRPSSATLAPEPFSSPPAIVPSLDVGSVHAPKAGRQHQRAALSSAIEDALDDEVTQTPALPRPELGKLQGRVPTEPEPRHTAVLTEATPAPYAADHSVHPGIKVFIPDAPIEERSRQPGQQAKRPDRPATGSQPIQQLAPISRQPHLGMQTGAAVRQGARQSKQNKKIILIVGAIALAGVAALALL